jgi:hypothetical protein
LSKYAIQAYHAFGSCFLSLKSEIRKANTEQNAVDEEEGERKQRKLKIEGKFLFSKPKMLSVIISPLLGSAMTCNAVLQTKSEHHKIDCSIDRQKEKTK